MLPRKLLGYVLLLNLMRSRVGSRGLLSILPVHPLYVPAGYPIFYPYFHCEFPMRFLDHFTVGSRAIPGGSIERTFRFACDLPAFPCASSKWFPSGNFVFTPCFCCGCSPANLSPFQHMFFQRSPERSHWVSFCFLCSPTCFSLVRSSLCSVAPTFPECPLCARGKAKCRCSVTIYKM